MNFESALKAMREGKRIKLPDWVSGCYLKLAFPELDLNEEMKLYCFHPSEFVDPTLDFDEILSEDWEIVE